MITLTIIREDLKDIRYYYGRKEMFDEAYKCTGKKNAIIEKVELYNNAMSKASPKLFDLYYSLYVKNYTQESLSNELGYTPEYIQMLNKQLLKFLQASIVKEKA